MGLVESTRCVGLVAGTSMPRIAVPACAAVAAAAMDVPRLSLGLGGHVSCARFLHPYGIHVSKDLFIQPRNLEAQGLAFDRAKLPRKAFF